ADPHQPDHRLLGLPPHGHRDGPGRRRPGDRIPPPRPGRAPLRPVGAGRAPGLSGRRRYPLTRPFGGGVIGNTAGSGPAIRGSSPCPRAQQTRRGVPEGAPFLRSHEICPVFLRGPVRVLCPGVGSWEPRRVGVSMGPVPARRLRGFAREFGGFSRRRTCRPGAARLALTVALAAGPTLAGAGPVAHAATAACLGQPATIVGTPGNDVINGTPGDDVISGLGGDDTINGNGGNDIICGDEGNDTIHGGQGDDVIQGGPGDDVIYGDEGSDTLNGNDGTDRVYGGPGDDDLSGGAGDDQLFGEDGNDSLSGGPGSDRCDGGPGTDTADSTCETKINIPYAALSPPRGGCPVAYCRP